MSNIAWHFEEDEAVEAVLLDHGIDAIEIAPSRIWAEPTAVDEKSARAEAERLRRKGLEIVSFQSLLFARPDLELFGDRAARVALATYLIEVLRLAEWMGARKLVFGSPKSRRVPFSMTDERARDIAAAFFRDLGGEAALRGISICIEPNPRAYGCNFVTNAAEGAELVRLVDSPGFSLHLDAAAMVMEGDDFSSAVRATGSILRHVHASAPQLGALEEHVVDHVAFARALSEIDYDQVVSVEMRASSQGANARRVSEAVDLAMRAYGRRSAAGRDVEGIWDAHPLENERD